ncbi:(Trans)glycosidase [Glarea lozoyensis ATCC 20868]|uniref:chitinase n=1 Tax=Glarea lozoyensis (strain ATCC 20868 / MF5171) TaxID=1116229 RepID=S3CZV3_GLAL2|nr:(Trans)glycosidase [Glarea lozoyensis ATCC 20868]EPE31140.1 (Trans)glycosidase [Glarea lozoyensis ATCC 20868]
MWLLCFIVRSGLAFAICALLITVRGESSSGPCPNACSGPPDRWGVYNTLEHLVNCGQPIFMDFALHNSLGDSSTSIKIRACVVEVNSPSSDTPPDASGQTPSNNDHYHSNQSKPLCSSASETKKELGLTVLESKSNLTPQLIIILKVAQTYLEEKTACDTRLLFGYYQGATVGIYTGSAFENHATTASIIQKLLQQQVKSEGATDMMAQVCGPLSMPDTVFGVITSTSSQPFTLLQNTVKSWSEGKCVEDSVETPQIEQVSVWEVHHTFPQPSISGRRLKVLTSRSDCQTMTVASGDNCESLASKCSILPSEFTKFNSDPNLCSKLQAGQLVCCEIGTIPDRKPQKQADGICATYTIAADDNCFKIAEANGLNDNQIEDFNNGTTWGWSGCNNIMVGTTICVSDGNPPMPAPVTNALCGPTKPGTVAPNGTQNLSDLSPCPLNACCNVWGQCGIDPEFCTEERGPSNNPGTSPPGKNSCIQNCGTNITNNLTGPEKSMSVGYYEAWNWDRPCLHRRVQDIDTNIFTHLHWAFGTVNSDFTVSVNDSNKQFTNFTALQNVKKIISFGGWGYSTSPETYDLLREAMMPSNAANFAKAITQFVADNKLDGVDFDWEYPGAPDLPGIPAGKDSDAPNYLGFLKQLRILLPAPSIISIAAPASYWYLKAFPIAEIAKTIDYIVYMTYDLHGQWDYRNSWSSSGCPKGNCLRSHVNMTETMYALAMITKAGVPSNKVNIGVSSYGRSFKMSESLCSGPTCSFEGPTSLAAEGECTGTPGILANAEIDQIIAWSDNATTHYDAGSESDILVYQETEWVAYLSDNSKKWRQDLFKKLNFGGSVDWAVDLQSFNRDTASPMEETEDEIDEQMFGGEPLPTCSESYTTFEQLEKDADTMPPNCKALYAVQAMDALLSKALANYSDIMSHGYDEKFDVYAGAVVDSASKNVVDFYTGNGNKYFTCVVLEFETCCSECRKKNPQPDAPACRYCIDGACHKRRDEPLTIGSGMKIFDEHAASLRVRESVGIIDSGGKPKSNSKYVNVTEPCPPDYSLRGSQGPVYTDSVYWTLQEDKIGNFWTDLTNATGITPDNIAFKNIQNYPCDGFPAEECIGVGQWAMNVPAPQGYDKTDIANPKDLVNKALANSQNLSPQIKDLLLTLRLHSYQGADPMDAVDALGIPVAMIADAVENMSKVAAIGKEIKDEEAKAKRSEILFGFLSAILFFIPVAGEVMSAVAGLATIGRIVALLGTLGNVAYDSYTIVNDPANAPLAIFGLILAPLGLADVVALAKAARIARDMQAPDVLKLGTNVGKRLGTLRKVTEICKK